ncbi:MAG TPA: GGDEF domain-containing protein [Polyangiaceae bacterium]
MAKTPAARRLGYLTADLNVPFERELLTHALRAAEKLGVELLAACGGRLRPQPTPDALAYDAVRRARLDGILLCAHTVCVGMSRDEIAEFARSFAPAEVVIVGVEVPGFGCHTVSNEAGAAALTEHLLSGHGRQHFALVAGPKGHQEAEARRRGVEYALRRHGFELPEERVFYGGFTHAGGRAAAEQLVARGFSDIDAVVFANDLMAIAALDVFARERVAIPSALSITGFDDIDLAHLARSPLTTVRQPLARQIEHALGDLLAAVNGRSSTDFIEHRTRLVLRRSCGCGLVTTEHAPSTPPRPPIGSDPMELLGRYDSAIAAELVATLKDSSLPRALDDDWANDLVDMFVARIRDHDASFIERIDASASALVQQDEPLTPLREAVLLLRRQLVALTGGAGPAADDLDDATAEALLTIGSVEALREAQRRRAFEAVAVELAAASAALAAAGSVAEVRDVAYRELERLQIPSCVPVLLSADGAAGHQVPFAFVAGERDAPVSLSSDGALELAPGVAPRLLLVPMASQGRYLGYVVYDAAPGSFLLSTRLTLALGAALRSAELMERLEIAYATIAQQALKDSLTGLWNRRFLETRIVEEVARADRAQTSLSILVVDLDGFKQVNDRYGHEAGDRVLVRVAERLVASLRPEDVVARIGGDEFVVLLAGTSRTDALSAAERAVLNLKHVDEHALVTASVGAATATPSAAEDDLGRRLLHEADGALLEAKRRGKCRALHYDDVTPVS